MKTIFLCSLLILCAIAGKLLADNGGIQLIGQGGTGTASSFTAGSAVFAGTSGIYTNVPVTLTKVQLDTKVPDGVGEIFVCSNCTVPYVICTATGTLASQFVAMKTGNGCGSGN